MKTASPSVPPAPREFDEPALGPLPQRLLYATSARIGGKGLALTAQESLLAAHQGEFLGRAIGFGNCQKTIPPEKIKSLRWHPARLLSAMRREHYYGVKKHYADWMAARELERSHRAGEGFDCFHGWSGESLRALRAARELGVPTLLDIPTWHRNKGKQKPYRTKSEKARERGGWWQRKLYELEIPRQRQLEEYDLASIILVQSKVAQETFLVQGFDEERVEIVGRGVDAEKIKPGPEPPVFRALFVGALIKRKGVHTLLEAWSKLGLKNAELVLVGSAHDEIKPALEQYGNAPGVKLAGYARDVAEVYANASIFVFPSQCEGSAKVTFEAGAAGLPQISTPEAGDFVVHGENGLHIGLNDPDALAAAIKHLYDNPALVREMGAAARRRVEENFTWDHFRAKLRRAYRKAMAVA